MKKPVNNFTWKCDSCKAERPDEAISVYSYYLKDLPGATRNWKYCNDNEDCFNKAVEKGKTGEI